MTSEALNLLLPGFYTFHTCLHRSNNGNHIAYVDMPKKISRYKKFIACDPYRDSLWRGNFPAAEFTCRCIWHSSLNLNS